MYPMFALIFMMAIISGMSFSATHTQDYSHQQAKALSVQMMTYHQAALKSCLSECSPGEIDPRDFLPKASRNAPAYTSGAFKSQVETEGTVFTVLDVEALVATGTVASAVAKKLEGQVGAGVYHQRSAKIVSASGSVSFSSPNVADGAVILMTKVY